MSFWEILKHLFKIENVNFSPNITINLSLFSGNKKSVYNREEKILRLNLNKVSPSELRELLESAVDKNDYLLLEEKARETLDDFRAVDGSTRNRQFLEYFQRKIPNEDLTILRASLYLKKVFDRGNPTEDLKQDIMRRYGDRGKNISNLCSAGYFESLIKPLYEVMRSSHGFSQDKFLSFYNIIVGEFPFAIFINRNMSKIKVREDFLAKIEKNRKYGIQTLNIHGIGEHNVGKIREVITELESTFNFEKELEEGKNYIVVRLKFPDSSSKS